MTKPLELFGEPTVKMTERQMLDLLRDRYSQQHGNGDRYAIAEHVRSHAGIRARRTADFIAMDLWPSKGLALHWHEVKVSRSDWLTELKKPEKAAEFTPYMTFSWLVVSDPKIVRDDLPDGWGLLAPRGARLAVVRPAKQNHKVVPVPRTMMAALLRATANTARGAR